MPADDDYKVSSELYEEHDYISDKKPYVNKDNVVSTFNFRIPPETAKRDEDGDLIVTRKSDNKMGIIEIEHSRSTVLDLVGLQIWRGALLLADWLLSNGHMIPNDTTILELGSGVGLTSIIAAMFAPVYSTDVDKGDILKSIQGNVTRNKTHCKYPVTVIGLDFTSRKLPALVEENLSKISVIITADVVYDDEITQEFVQTLERLLSNSDLRKSVYVALEKRYVFTLADCDSVAPCFEFFLRCLNSSKNLKYELLPLDFPQYFQYDRVKELVFMKISSQFL